MLFFFGKACLSIKQPLTAHDPIYPQVPSRLSSLSEGGPPASTWPGSTEGPSMIPGPKFRTCGFVDFGPGDIMVLQFHGTSHMIVSAHGATTPQALFGGSSFNDGTTH